MAFFYYFMTVGMYMLSPRMAYHFSECVERHAYSTYDKFLKLHEGNTALMSFLYDLLVMEHGHMVLYFRSCEAVRGKSFRF